MSRLLGLTFSLLGSRFLSGGRSGCPLAGDYPAGNTRPVKTRGDYRHTDIITHIRINDCTEDQVDIRVCSFLNDRSSGIDLEQGQFWAAGHIEEDSAGAVNGDIQQVGW